MSVIYENILMKTKELVTICSISQSFSSRLSTQHMHFELALFNSDTWTFAAFQGIIIPMKYDGQNNVRKCYFYYFET